MDPVCPYNFRMVKAIVNKKAAPKKETKGRGRSKRGKKNNNNDNDTPLLLSLDNNKVVPDLHNLTHHLLLDELSNSSLSFPLQEQDKARDFANLAGFISSTDVGGGYKSALFSTASAEAIEASRRETAICRAPQPQQHQPKQKSQNLKQPLQEQDKPRDFANLAGFTSSTDGGGGYKSVLLSTASAEAIEASRRETSICRAPQPQQRRQRQPKLKSQNLKKPLKNDVQQLSIMKDPNWPQLFSNVTIAELEQHINLNELFDSWSAHLPKEMLANLDKSMEIPVPIPHILPSKPLSLAVNYIPVGGQMTPESTEKSEEILTLSSILKVPSKRKPSNSRVKSVQSQHVEKSVSGLVNLTPQQRLSSKEGTTSKTTNQSRKATIPPAAVSSTVLQKDQIVVSRKRKLVEESETSTSATVQVPTSFVQNQTVVVASGRPVNSSNCIISAEQLMELIARDSAHNSSTIQSYQILSSTPQKPQSSKLVLTPSTTSQIFLGAENYNAIRTCGKTFFFPITKTGGKTVSIVFRQKLPDGK